MFVCLFSSSASTKIGFISFEFHFGRRPIDGSASLSVARLDSKLELPASSRRSSGNTTMSRFDSLVSFVDYLVAAVVVVLVLVAVADAEVKLEQS